jgi:RNA-dependent RNA polymerase
MTDIQEPLRDAYNIHVKHTRDEAMKAVQDITFRTRLTPEQVVARHCYALTYEKRYVEAWEEEQRRGFLEEEGGDVEYMRPR